MTKSLQIGRALRISLRACWLGGIVRAISVRNIDELPSFVTTRIVLRSEKTVELSLAPTESRRRKILNGFVLCLEGITELPHAGLDTNFGNRIALMLSRDSSQDYSLLKGRWTC
jgi:hypothetical protein